MRILTALLFLVSTATIGCAARTQVKAKDNSATIAPTVEGDTTTEVAPDDDDRDHHKDARAEHKGDHHDDD